LILKHLILYFPSKFLNSDANLAISRYVKFPSGSFLHRAKIQNRNRGRASRLKRWPTRLLCDLSFDKEDIRTSLWFKRFVIQ